jgi:hypothetical protein
MTRRTELCGFQGVERYGEKNRTRRNGQDRARRLHGAANRGASSAIGGRRAQRAPTESRGARRAGKQTAESAGENIFARAGRGQDEGERAQGELKTDPSRSLAGTRPRRGSAEKIGAGEGNAELSARAGVKRRRAGELRGMAREENRGRSRELGRRVKSCAAGCCCRRAGRLEKGERRRGSEAPWQGLQIRRREVLRCREAGREGEGPVCAGEGAAGQHRRDFIQS